MLYDHLTKFFKEMNLEGGSISKEITTFSLELEGSPIVISDASPGIELSATLGACPQEKQIETFTKMLRGNFLGQATRRARLGLSEDGMFVVLLAAIPTIRSYREFKDTLEDFVNAVSFWKTELSTT